MVNDVLNSFTVIYSIAGFIIPILLTILAEGVGFLVGLMIYLTILIFILLVESCL